VEIRRGASLDVHELDAASNRKLDEMRDLLSRVALGTSGRWKVYIVDEVHQLTPDAASALLKTLEEPPAHVVFVLATTDPQKVLPTIRSRTQHFEFRLLSSEVLGHLLTDVNTQASLGVPPEAIDLVVRRGHGSARDALSVLDQVAAAGGVEDEASVVVDIVEAVAERDPQRVLVAVAEGMAAGREPRRLTAELLDHLRNGFLATQARGLLLLPDDAAAVVEEQARRLGLARLVRAMEIVGTASTEMRDSVDPRVTLEVALLRLAAPAADTDPAALAERIERLEATVAGGAPPGPPRSAPAMPGAAPAAPARSAPAMPAGAAPAPAAGPAPPPAAGPAPPPAGRPPPGRAGVPPPPPTPGRGTIGSHRRPQPPSPAEPAGRPDPGPSPDPAPARRAGGPLPSRDELTKAWGDIVLAGLRPGVKVYLAPGRFVSVDADAAVYALPDKGLISRAQPVRGEAEAALAAHFGRPVPLRLVLDDGGTPVGGREEPPTEPEDPAGYDLDQLEDAEPGVTSPEQRLMEAFPGAEEVVP
jgi:DNA polymerase-3 subunit gamma/tau